MPKSPHNEISSDQVKEGLRLGIVRLGKAGGKVALCDDGDQQEHLDLVSLLILL